MSGRDTPTRCSKPCLAPVCTPALNAERRAQAGYWLAVACGCLICQEHIVKDARPRRGKC